MSASIFVAPHPDDVALSCGGAVAIAARDSDPMIVTVFAGQPAGDESVFARMQHERWGIGATSVAEARRAEDICAAAALGDRAIPISLDYLDAIYRNAAYDSDDALFGTLMPDDDETTRAVTESLAEMGAEQVFVPLSIGNHVDHQIVFRAGQRLATRGVDVWAYPDVPYVLSLRSTGRSIPDGILVGMLGEERLTFLDPDAWERRIAAIDCYSSQLHVIFRDHGDHRAALDRYLRNVGQGERAEICWRVLPVLNR